MVEVYEKVSIYARKQLQSDSRHVCGSFDVGVHLQSNVRLHYNSRFLKLFKFNLFRPFESSAFIFLFCRVN